MSHADPRQVVEIATQYHAAGIRVVPVYPPDASVSDPGKQPIGSGWQHRLWTREALKSVIESKNANIGVLCGKLSGFVCVDIDPKHGGMRWFVEHEHELGAHLCEETGSGGFHLYYRFPSGYERLDSFSGVNGIAPGVEFKADGGVQVVTAPSLHKLGKQYSFHHGLTLLDLETEADEPPAWLLDVVKARMAQKSAFVPVGTGTGLVDDSGELERAVAYLARVGNKQEGDGRRNAAYRIACTGRDFGLTPKTWWPHVVRWNEGNVPPIDDLELRKTFSNGYKYPKSPPGSKTVAAEFPDDLEPEALLTPEAREAQASELGDDGYPHKHPVISARKFLKGQSGLIYADETFYQYLKNTWKVVDKDALYSQIWREIVSTDSTVCLKSSHVNEVLKALQAQCFRYEATFDRWDDNRPGDFVRVENGILDLNRVELLPHSPEWLSLTKLPFAYDETARCPRFESFLESIWGSGETADQIEALQLWFGYILSAKTSQQRFAMFLGHSRGGKGTLMRLMQRLLGETNCFAMNLEAFRGNFALQELPGKKLITIADAHAGTHEGTSACAQFVLNVTGEDSISIDRKNRSIVQARLGAKIVIGANHMPKFFDSNSSITNRMILFRFVRSFQGREDPGLEDVLISEMPGILNWAIQGLEKLNAAGKLIKPLSASATLAEIAEALNPSEAFVREFVIPGETDDSAYVDEVYEIYKLWCADNGHKGYAKSRLSAVISECFAGNQTVKRETTSWRAGHKRSFFRGVKLRCSIDAYRSGVAISVLPDSDSDLYGDDGDCPF